MTPGSGRARAQNGNTAASSDQTFTTATPPDTTPPTVNLTVPSSRATVSGTSVTLTATASDNIAVASVQFKVDGANIGAAITSSPYTTTWDSTGIADGSHTLYAVAEDTSANYATFSISLTVNNTVITAGPLITSTYDHFGNIDRFSNGSSSWSIVPGQPILAVMALPP
jgi:predicted phage tail protein